MRLTQDRLNQRHYASFLVCIFFLLGGTFGLEGCMWKAGLKTPFETLEGEQTFVRTLHPPSSKAFQPMWRALLGLKDTFSSTRNFISGVAVHAKYPIVALVGFDRNLQIRHKENGQLLHTLKLPASGVGSPIFDQDQLLITTKDGRLSSYDLKTNTLKWSRQFSGLLSTPLTLDQKRIYVVDGSNSLYALHRTTGKIIWQKRRDPPKDFSLFGESQPHVYQDLVYMGYSDGQLIAYQIQDGREVWSKDLAPQRDQFQDVDADFVLYGNILYAASAASGLYALDPRTGKRKWFFPIEGIVRLNAIENDLLIGLQHGEIGRFSTSDHAFRWRLQFGGEGFPSRPIVFHQGIVVGVSRGGLYVLNAQDGQIKDQFDAGSGLLAPLTLSKEGHLYVSSLDGYLYAFAPR
jgi:outer membrane protein assembly factor BamB